VIYQVLISRSAEKQLKKLPLEAQRKVAAVIVSLGIEPRPYGCKKLSGTEDSYRVRVGDYRIIYDISERKVLVTVLKIAHRRDVYR
jgi:mRNA interferase RelE/StbE